MLTVLKNGLQDFKVSYKKYLSFELIFLLLTSFIFVPVISFIFNRMLKVMGNGALLNAEVYKIASSYTGVVGMLIISFFAVIILFLEFGILIIIAQKRYFNKNILISEAFVTALRNLPKLLGFGVFQFIILLFLLTPFINIPVLPALLDFNMPIFLTSQFYESYLVIIIYVTVFLLVMYLSLRCIFMFHYIFIEGKTIWEAMKASFKITKYNKLRILVSLFLLNIVFFLFGFLFVTFISNLVSLIETKIIGDIVENYLLTFSSYMTITFSLLLIPINIIIITRLFYQYKLNQSDEIQDQLHLNTNKSLARVENYLIHFFTKRKYTLLFVIMVFLTGSVVINYSVHDNIVYLKWDVSVASHRGDLMNAPENSMSSISSAIDKGVDAVEIDVQMTKDGVVVLNHDTNLQRIAGLPSKISNMTFEEVSKIDIGQLYAEEFKGERIPTLNAVLEEVKQEDVKLIIDTKPVDTKEGFVEKVVQAIEFYDMEGTTYIQSFDYDILREVRMLNSNIKIGQIIYLSAGNLSSLDVDFYTIRQSMLTERFIDNAREQNREVWVWTVNTERNMNQVLKYDIDGIITDYPEKAQNVIGIDFAQ
ncbi:glycerophosphodiester phosphodiesterase [Aquibacillus rhizosphaerae]|uniref:Glycerophosphodiester phosphodiesterase n=1 Tax=Aquibacillus rhizosphaerae TaxID=3051431 RepID=A0ABT7L0I8_9BACI|nr:glycerophosphodiester phosphodiesterase [Aquibacillus sp. LR5S19]MDL4839326.1 glycerophosphodiester phosphodiesterase [Aquibacillus sp. LR5S19]